MLDFKTWADKAASFITDRAAKQGFKGEASIKRPLSPDQVAELESSIQTKLPRELKLFLLHGSAGCQFRYEWTPPESSSEKISEMFPPGTILYGGASICDASMLSTMLED